MKRRWPVLALLALALAARSSSQEPRTAVAPQEDALAEPGGAEAPPPAGDGMGPTEAMSADRGDDASGAPKDEGSVSVKVISPSPAVKPTATIAKPKKGRPKGGRAAKTAKGKKGAKAAAVAMAKAATAPPASPPPPPPPPPAVPLTPPTPRNP